MKLKVIFSILLLGAAAHSQDSKGVPESFVCRAVQGTEVTQLTLERLSSGNYRGELSVFGRFNYVPSPPPVQKVFPLVRKVFGTFIEANGAFELDIRASEASLNLNGQYFDMTCSSE